MDEQHQQQNNANAQYDYANNTVPVPDSGESWLPFYQTTSVNYDEWLNDDAYLAPPLSYEQETLDDSSGLQPPTPPLLDPVQQVSPWATGFPTAFTSTLLAEQPKGQTLLVQHQLPDLRRELSNSKKRTTTGLSLFAQKEAKAGKRLKKVVDGYSCKDPDCDKIFNRQCDADKHWGRTHDPQGKKHPCIHCVMTKWFKYPKDVRRHERQVHHIEHTEPEPETHSAPPTPAQTKPEIGRKLAALNKLNTQAATSNQINTQRSDSNSNTASPDVLSPSTPKSAAFSSLARGIMKLKQLSITAKNREEKLIMVTLDKTTFVEVDVTGIHAADALLSKVLTALDLGDYLHPEHVSVQTYRRRRGSVHLGEILGRHKLMALVARVADRSGSFKLLVTPDYFSTDLSLTPLPSSR